MDKYFKANKKYWNALTSINKNSEFYELKKILKGKTSLKNNLKILSFNEYDYSAYNCFNNMVEEKKDVWKIKGYENILPLMFSIKAEKKKHHN